jgi:hypothetical protein
MDDQRQGQQTATPESERSHPLDRLRVLARMAVVGVGRLYAKAARWSRDPTFFTAVIAFATVAYVVVSFCQLRALQQGNEQTQRAWITVIATSFEIKAGMTIKADITIENAGNTPAVITASGRRLRMQPVGEPLRFTEDPSWRTGGMIVGPKHHVLSGPIIGPLITQAHIDALKAKTSVLYQYGRIEYRDPFDKPRETRYCHVYDPDRDRFYACGTGNSFR